MESQSVSEVRRLHIVYFLCREGRTEHPHLIRLHHNSRNGIRLRDVKRWLGELRGKDMAEGFAWSYKRKYKTGYVWQDLVDEDLITPISDNEYVLKGSEISYRHMKEEKVGKQTNQEESQSQSQYSEASSVNISTKSSEIEEESPTFGSKTSTVTDDSGKVDATNDDSKSKGRVHHSPALFSTLLRRKAKKKSSRVTSLEKISTPAAAAAAAAAAADSSESSPPDPNSTKSKSHSDGHANIFRNLITCGAAETNDSAVVAINKQNSKPPHFLSMCVTDARKVKSAELCSKDRLGGSQRVFRNLAWTQLQDRGRKSFDEVKDSAKNKCELREQRAATFVSNKVAANWPSCSQCGKLFNPEKLHAHMRACKGIKESQCRSDADAAMFASQKTSKAPAESSSFSGQLLIH